MKNNNIRIFLQLIKVTVSLPVTFLCFAGYYLHTPLININIWLISLGVFLLSSASSVLNQIIEKKYDAKMDRTKNRPLPTGAITIKSALLISALLIISGASILLYYSILAMCLGLLAIIWYILVYTLLKRITPFATIPGALTGALPLLIGFTASGGFLFNHSILLIATFIYIWQIPHFWLLMLVYNNDYIKAGFPTLFRIFSEPQLKLWTLGWVITMIVCSLNFIPFEVITHLLTKYLLIFLNTFTLLFSAYCLFTKDVKKHKIHFHFLNAYMLLVIFLVIADRNYL